MKIPPKKPHFFKPILPGFKNGIKIPVGFLKYLKGYEHIKLAVLKRGDKKWRIKVNEHRFEEGNWGKFVEENDLQLGDLLVFRHEGNMEFEVSVFDSTHCDREYGEYQQEEGERGAPSVGVISKKFEVKDLRANASLQLEGKKPNLDAKRVSSRRIRATVPASTSANANSQFVSIIRPYAIGRAVFFLPSDFARLNGLMRRCKMMLRDERQRLWPVQLDEVGHRFAFTKGWRQFREANAVQVGDSYKFELIDNGIIPIAYFRQKPRPNIKKAGKCFSNVEATYKNMQLIHPHFICTIRPYCLSKRCLRIPKKFAQENRLNDRKHVIIMRDGRRSWRFGLFTSGASTFIGSGWREFCLTNCFKEGDILMFEVVSNGETPIFKFHDLRGSPFLQPDVKKKNLDGERISDKESQAANPHFISTIKPYTLRFPVLYLPMGFAKSNGLLDRHQMILVDENQRAWSMLLGQVDRYHFGIKRGWREFIKTKDVQVGDTYKFELTNNGTIPVIHFHCKYEALADGKGN